VEIRGNTKARIFWYADCGVTAVSNCIVVHNDLIKEEPELVRAFISASLKGFLYGRQNLDEMIAIARKYSPAIEPAIARREAEMSWQSWISPNTAGKPFGWMAEKDWEETVEVLKQYGGVTTPLAAQQLYTNEFVPAGVEFIPPPADADKK
jgi:NitT/TauT family transport system substrate-binding protein